MNKITLSPCQMPFDLDMTMSCGQIFGWKKTGDTWSGVHKKAILALTQKDTTIYYSGLNKTEIINFLGLEHDMPSIITSIQNHITRYSKTDDPFFTSRVEQSQGLRILHQDPWECLVSFICSANSNVRTIRKRINLILDTFGPTCSPGKSRYPDPKILGACTEVELRECLTGYRAPYLQKTAQYIIENPDFLKDITTMDYRNAKSALMVLPGVGPKVADCVLLFSYKRFEAVPVDVRIRKIIEQHYSYLLTNQGSGKYSYDDIADFCREYFGPYAGYAQQFLFATRDM